MKRIIILCSFFLICSCKGQTRIDPIKTFEDELTDSALEKFKNNCPYNRSESFLTGSSFYASFEILGNSGAELMFNLKKDEIKSLESVLKKYTLIDNKEIKIQDYNIFYPYNNKLLLFNDISTEWEEVLGKVDLRNKEVEIYLIENGKLTSAFKEEGTDSKSYNYTCGIYLFKKINKLIYWFMIYK